MKRLIAVLSILIGVSMLLGACAPAATPAPTAMPAPQRLLPLRLRLPLRPQPLHLQSLLSPRRDPIYRREAVGPGFQLEPLPNRQLCYGNTRAGL